MIRWALARVLVATVGAAPMGKAARILSPRGFAGGLAHNIAFPSVLLDSSTGGYRTFYGSPTGRINASTWDQRVTLTAASGTLPVVAVERE